MYTLPPPVAGPCAGAGAHTNGSTTSTRPDPRVDNVDPQTPRVDNVDPRVDNVDPPTGRSENLQRRPCPAHGPVKL